MLSGHLGKIGAADHKTELAPGAESVYRAPYRAIQRSREFEEAKGSSMWGAGVLKPKLAEWANPVVFVSKIDDILHFCVDYRKMDTVSLTDLYHTLHTEKCIQLLSDAAMSTTLDCFRG